MLPTDPLYGQQWHFTMLGNGRGRALLELVWNEFSGAGIHVAVYDTGIEVTHADLNDNYNASLEVTINGVGGLTHIPGNYIAPADVKDPHGTAVAGIIGAEKNAIGGTGIAWGVDLTSVNIWEGAGSYGTFPNTDHWLTYHEMYRFDVINHSWGWDISFNANENTINTGAHAEHLRTEYNFAVANGRGGLGTIVVKAAGNDNNDAALSSANDLWSTLTVGALRQDGFAASYSNYGACLLVSAAAGEYGGTGNNAAITTTDQTGTRLDVSNNIIGNGYNLIGSTTTASDYTDRMNGTSAATPMVSGVVALMLDANPNLGWRDVQNILAATAFHTGSAIGAVSGTNEDHTWVINHADTWNGGGMHYSLDYGYGSLDAFGAVRMAESYAIIAAAALKSNNIISATASLTGLPDTIPDNNPTGITKTIILSGNVSIEHLTLTLGLTHPFPHSLQINLTSPEGTVYHVQKWVNEPVNIGGLTNQLWRWGVDGLRGELSAGTWTLQISDNVSSAGPPTYNLHSVAITAFGTAAPAANDTFILTDEFAQMRALSPARGVISDVDGGTDWVNGSALSANATLRLTPGQAGSVDGAAVSFSAGTTIENAILGDGNDLLVGNGVANKLYGMRGNDTIRGGLGADRIDGGAGKDVASYLGASAGVKVALDGTIVKTGEAVGDTFFGIEDLAGSDLVDTLIGNAGANTLTGNNGADFLFGRAAVDILLGGAGNDKLIGGTGGDVLNGGADIDTASYEQATSRVQVALDNSLVKVGEAVGDTLSLVENLIGSGFNDTLSGSSGNNTLWGLGGIDTLDGRGGNDFLYGGLGNDILRGNVGADTLIGESGADRYQYWSSAEGLDSITLFAADDIMMLNAVAFGVTDATLALRFRARADNFAQDGDDRLIFRTTDSTLWFDSNGSLGGGVKVMIADFVNSYVLTIADIDLF